MVLNWVALWPHKQAVEFSYNETFRKAFDKFAEEASVQWQGPSGECPAAGQREALGYCQGAEYSLPPISGA